MCSIIHLAHFTTRLPKRRKSVNNSTGCSRFPRRASACLSPLLPCCCFSSRRGCCSANVARSLALDGLLVEAGETLPGSRRTVQALVWVGSDAAPRIEAGMPAALELALADGESGIVEGRIATIAAVPLSEGLAALAARAPVSVYRVDIALDESLDPASLAGRNCRIVIELGSQSLVSLMRAGQS